MKTRLRCLTLGILLISSSTLMFAQSAAPPSRIDVKYETFKASQPVTIDLQSVEYVDMAGNPLVVKQLTNHFVKSQVLSEFSDVIFLAAKRLTPKVKPRCKGSTFTNANSNSNIINTSQSYTPIKSSSGFKSFSNTPTTMCYVRESWRAFEQRYFVLGHC